LDCLRDLTTCCAIRGDLDRARLGALGLRDHELQNAVRELRLDLVRVDLHRQGEGALELPGAPLLTEPAVLRGVRLRLDLAAERDRVARGVDLDVLRGQTGQVRAKVVCVLRLPEVHRHADLAGNQTGPPVRPGEAVLEETIHGLAERHDVGAGAEESERHRLPPLLELNAISARAISWPRAPRVVRRLVAPFLIDRRLRGRGLVLRRELLADLAKELGRVAELEQELDARKVHAPDLREVPDGADALQVVVGVEPDVGLRTHRLEQAFLLVDPERARVTAGQARGDRDHVDRPTSYGHLLSIKPNNAVVKTLPPRQKARERRSRPPTEGPRAAEGSPADRGRGYRRVERVSGGGLLGRQLGRTLVGPCASVWISARPTRRSPRSTAPRSACCRSTRSRVKRCRRSCTSGETARRSSADGPSTSICRTTATADRFGVKCRCSASASPPRTGPTRASRPTSSRTRAPPAGSSRRSRPFSGIRSTHGRTSLGMRKALKI